VANTKKNPKEECKVIFTRSQRRENAEREKKVDGVLEYVSYDEGENKKREKDEEEKNESKERGDEVFPIKPKVS